MKNSINTIEKRVLSAKITLVISVFLLMVVLFFGWSLFIKEGVPKNVLESAILKNDWQKVFNECKNNDSLLMKPETAALMGHAAIMLNKNNVAYILFNYIDIDTIRKAGWQSWANDFQKRFSKRAIAYYFQGDAYMRNHEQDKAHESFNKAIKIDQKFSLAFNARGILNDIMNDKKSATKDFDEACKLNPGIADFYANRATMYYNDKAPEAAYNNYSKAVGLSPDFALALNGKACSSFYFMPHEKSSASNLDSIYSYLYSALERLNIPVIQTNIRSIILEYENRMFPDQIETPLFIFSDFLDWQSLRQLSLKNSYDVFHYILREYLPEKINTSFLYKINALIGNNILFQAYLQNKNAPDSIKSIIVKTIDENKLNKQTRKDQIETQNRLTLERIYSGLIASYKKRIPGTTIKVNPFSADNIGNIAGLVRQGVKDIPSLGILDAHPIVFGTKSVTYGIASMIQAGALLKDISNANHALDRIEKDPNNMKNQQILKIENPSAYNRLYNPGGALADVHRKIIDDKAYSLICIFSLGYDSK